MSRIRIGGIALLVLMVACTPVAAVGGESVAHERPSIDTVDDCSFPVTMTDDSGTEVTLEDEPETVVTLNPSAAQTMWEIGAEEKVVGTTKHAENLEGASERTNISTDAETIEPEIVVDLEPDLVLAPSSNFVSEETVETLREAGVTVYYFQSAESLEEVRERTLLVGSLVGECEGAEETVAWMDDELEIVEAALEGEERPDVLYTFFGFTAGEETFIHELIETGGGTNVAAEAGVAAYEQLSEETVVEQDPDWIVLNTNSPEMPDSSAYESTTAVQSDQVVTVDINHLNRPGPRVIHAITTFAETFHPEAYAAATADAADEPTGDGDSADDDGGDSSADDEPDVDDDAPAETTESDDETAGDDADGVPGFGLASAATAAAVVAVALAAIGSLRHRNDRS
ncbi:PGF-CTERM-anchored ABC transporter substrate-binding protein [Natrarchaeobius sp. A-rgal3]|uniref:PGF-CTERM-anchored ABC transporter substrate-binding protein n=1 Tax=Natrarchaeobius versutus TaxID=1679078 RepID=UPI00350FC550